MPQQRGIETDCARAPTSEVVQYPGAQLSVTKTGEFVAGCPPAKKWESASDQASTNVSCTPAVVDTQHRCCVRAAWCLGHSIARHRPLRGAGADIGICEGKRYPY